MYFFGYAHVLLRNWSYTNAYLFKVGVVFGKVNYLVDEKRTDSFTDWYIAFICVEHISYII